MREHIDSVLGVVVATRMDDTTGFDDTSHPAMSVRLLMSNYSLDRNKGQDNPGKCITRATV